MTAWINKKLTMRKSRMLYPARPYVWPASSKTLNLNITLMRWLNNCKKRTKTVLRKKTESPSQSLCIAIMTCLLTLLLSPWASASSFTPPISESLCIDLINRPLLPSFTSQIEINGDCVFHLSALVIFKAPIPFWGQRLPCDRGPYDLSPLLGGGGEGAEGVGCWTRWGFS